MCQSSKSFATLAMLLLFFALTAGCGKSKPVASPEDKSTARKALVAALDAWQAGELTALASRSPPIRFQDDDVSSGHALVSYELDPSLEIVPHHDVVVNLIVRDRAGDSVHRTATYQVTLSPAIAVLRNDP